MREVRRHRHRVFEEFAEKQQNERKKVKRVRKELKKKKDSREANNVRKKMSKLFRVEKKYFDTIDFHKVFDINECHITLTYYIISELHQVKIE